MKPDELRIRVETLRRQLEAKLASLAATNSNDAERLRTKLAKRLAALDYTLAASDHGWEGLDPAAHATLQAWLEA